MQMRTTGEISLEGALDIVSCSMQLFWSFDVALAVVGFINKDESAHDFSVILSSQRSACHDCCIWQAATDSALSHATENCKTNMQIAVTTARETQSKQNFEKLYLYLRKLLQLATEQILHYLKLGYIWDFIPSARL